MARDVPSNRQSRRQTREPSRQDTYEDIFGSDYDGDGTPYEAPDDAYEYEDEEEEEEFYPPPRTRRPARPPAPRPPRTKPALISTNATINLTCALAASTGVVGLFLYFADKRSIAVRRTAVQSACLFMVNCFLTAILWALASVLSAASLWGNAFWILWVVYFAVAGIFRWQLALHAYRGQSYVIPLVGEFSRRFE